MEETFESDGEFVERNSSVIGHVLPGFHGFLYFGFGLINFALFDESVPKLGQSVGERHSSFTDLCF